MVLLQQIMMMHFYTITTHTEKLRSNDGTIILGSVWQNADSRYRLCVMWVKHCTSFRALKLVNASDDLSGQYLVILIFSALVCLLCRSLYVYIYISALHWQSDNLLCRYWSLNNPCLLTTSACFFFSFFFSPTACVALQNWTHVSIVFCSDISMRSYHAELYISLLQPTQSALLPYVQLQLTPVQRFAQSLIGVSVENPSMHSKPEPL